MSENKYIVFAHGIRLSDENKPNFQLDKNYRVITLHIPNEEIKENLVKIILNQINDKMDMLDSLFDISCPIGRNNTRIAIENNFIKDYFRSIFKTDPKKVNTEIRKIFNKNRNISDLKKLNEFLERQNYEETKKQLHFEIRTYRAGDNAPRMLLQFKMTKNLSLIPGGIYTKDTFKDFNFDSKSDAIAISSIANIFGLDENMESLVNFDLDKSY